MYSRQVQITIRSAPAATRPRCGVGLLCLVASVLVDRSSATRRDHRRRAVLRADGDPPRRPAHVPVRVPGGGAVARPRAAVLARGVVHAALVARDRGKRGRAVRTAGEFEIGRRSRSRSHSASTLSPPLLVVLLRHGRSIDPASILVLTLGSLVHRPPPEARADDHGAVGVAVRESSLFLIPFAYAVWARTVSIGTRSATPRRSRSCRSPPTSRCGRRSAPGVASTSRATRVRSSRSDRHRPHGAVGPHAGRRAEASRLHLRTALARSSVRAAKAAVRPPRTRARGAVRRRR